MASDILSLTAQAIDAKYPYIHPKFNVSRHMHPYFKKPPKNHSAFTLIELSIVLVIIGLIVGGVLVGQDLIQIARAQSSISQMQSYETAITTFKLKYSCLPGDCKNASNFGLGISGNGDKLIGNTTGGYPGGSIGGCLTGSGGAVCHTHTPGILSNARGQIYRPYGEAQRVWAHLSSAGLIDDFQDLDASTDPTDNMSLYFPKSKSGKGHILAFMWNRNLYFRTGFSSQNIWQTAFYEIPSFNSTQMKYIYNKMGYDEIVTGPEANLYSETLNTKHKVFPLGKGCGNSTTCGYFSAVYVSPDQHNTKKCAISDGAGGHQFDLENNGECNMLWHAYR